MHRATVGSKSRRAPAISSPHSVHSPQCAVGQALEGSLDPLALGTPPPFLCLGHRLDLKGIHARQPADPGLIEHHRSAFAGCGRLIIIDPGEPVLSEGVRFRQRHAWRVEVYRQGLEIEQRHR